ncbi:ArsR family transcriptional regulator [Nonomuraea sp. NPDC049480]|uniref:arsenate reductase/protein-tyrosine-phosphatase family protein n=1 Tax=Nonomuraea sp. NPDC049480 TaxID=3364353 RepID=UPI0037B696F8
MSSGTQLAPPAFARMAADPLRWRLLRELAVSDRRVRELVTLVGQPQNLVSYHLSRLRASGMAAARRSNFDGRDTYYRLDLERCAELLAEAGAALHPGLAFDPAPTTAPKAPRPSSCKVLFLCTGNSARSQAAEALIRARSGGRVQSFSAGSQPKPLHPHAVRVMAARGVDIAGQQSKHLRVFARRRLHYVITLCDRVREVCPAFPGDPTYIHWSIPDPNASGAQDTHGDNYPAFELMAAEIETRIGFWLAAIGAAPSPSVRA